MSATPLYDGLLKAKRKEFLLIALRIKAYDDSPHAVKNYLSGKWELPDGVDRLVEQYAMKEAEKIAGKS